MATNFPHGIRSKGKDVLQEAENALQEAENALNSTIKIDRDVEEAYKTIEELNRYTREFPFPEGKALMAIRFDDNDETFYTEAFQIMKERGLVGSLAFVEDRAGLYGRPKLTDEQTKEMLNQGWEMENHSYRHGKDQLTVGNTPTTYDEIYREVVQSKKNLEADFNQTIRNFTMPGNWDNNAQPPEDTLFAKMMLQHHLFFQAYVTGAVLERNIGVIRWGRANTSGDHGDAQQLITNLETIAGTTRNRIFKFHAVGEPGGGLNECISPANFELFCDKAKELIDAGELECVTTSALLASSVGEEINYSMNHNFTMGSDGLSRWITEGSPTVSDQVQWNGKNSVLVDQPNYAYQQLTTMYGLGSPKFKIRLRYRAVDGTTTARVSITDPMQATADARRYDLPATTDWKTFETQTGFTSINTGTNRLLVSLRGNVAGEFVAFSGIEIIRIG